MLTAHKRREHNRLRWTPKTATNDGGLLLRRIGGDLVWAHSFHVYSSGRCNITYGVDEQEFLNEADDPYHQWLMVMNESFMALHKMHAQQSGFAILNKLRKFAGLEPAPVSVLYEASRRHHREGWGRIVPGPDGGPVEDYDA